MRSSPLGVSIGVGGGLSPTHRLCAGTNKDNCDNPSFGEKLWVGYDVSNDVTAQVSYLYFNGVTRYKDAGDSHISERVTSSAWAAGIDWHIELLHTVTNHLRVGMARLKTEQVNVLSSGGESSETGFKTVPYVGAGLSMPVTDYFSIDASFDYLFASAQSRHLLYIGASANF